MIRMPTIIDRRRLLASTAGSALLLGTLPAAAAEPAAALARQPIVDTHMHVWAAAADKKRYPFPHPYQPDFTVPPHPATLEMLVEDMDRHGCTHAVLVQVIYHGWDNTYVADCVRRDPRRFKAHGLIDPTDPKVAEKLEFWMKEHGLAGMRFSPLYYAEGKLGGDGWLTAEETHRVWRVAEKLGAVFNFFITPPQLPKLAKMVAAHPDVPVIVDHLGQMDLGVEDPEPQVRQLLAMARHPNVYVKVSELSSVSKSKEYPFADAYPVVKRVYEAFGPNRLLFGTGYPGAARAHYKRPELDREIDLIGKQISFFSDDDRQKILGGNALRLWGFK
jgi:predicted TIM-barrel fold metal-dependent hydrolase